MCRRTFRPVTHGRVSSRDVALGAVDGTRDCFTPQAVEPGGLEFTKELLRLYSHS